MKKCILTFFLFLGFSSLCFAEPPYILNKMENGWTKTVPFDISNSDLYNTNDWKGEVYAYEAANYKGDFVGYIVAIVNNKDQECYYSLIGDLDTVYDMLRYYQTNYIWKEDFTTLATEMGDYAITKMFEDKDGKFWKLYGDCLSLTVLLNHDSKFYRAKVLPKFYDCVKKQAGDDVEITFEEFLDKIPLFMDTYLESVEK